MPYATVFVGRHPPPKKLVEKTLFAIGSLLRGTGRALDAVGAAVEGPYATKDPLVPNTAWMPFPASKEVTPPAGVTPRSVPLNPLAKDAPRLDIVAPLKGSNVFVAQNATVIGNVKVGDNSSIWYGAVLRGDVNSITIGSNTNIQDNVVVHVARASISGEPRPTQVGSNVTVGHSATLHACTVGDGCLVGMGATLLDGVVMEPGSIVAAGAVVPPGSVVKKGQVWAGAPAKLLRTLTPEEAGFVGASAANYAHLAAEHKVEAEKAFEEVVLDQAIAGEKLWRNRTDIDVHRGIARDPDTQVIISMR